MMPERRMADSAFGGPGAAAGSARGRRRWRGGEVVGRGSWVAATRIGKKKDEIRFWLVLCSGLRDRDRAAVLPA